MNPGIVYEDADLLVIDKPPGLVVTPSETQKEQTLVDFLRKHYDTLVYHSEDAKERMGIVHRLDKNTSGVLLVAKTKTAFDNLQSQFKGRIVKKEYLALVHGWVEKGGVLDAAIARNPGNREKFTVLPGRVSAREAVTEYEPVGNFQFSIFNLNNESSSATLQSIFSELNKIQMRKLEKMNYNQFTLLKCHPLTGRTHQIRVHLKYINHPIVSDEIYTGRKVYRLDKRWCPRQFLHAQKIGFEHPKSRKWMEVESELPEDLKKVLENLKS